MLNKKKVLGRGLGALIGEAARPSVEAAQQHVATAPGPQDKYLLCPVSDISPNRVQPRKRFEDSTLKELADSIREKGVIEPLLVRRTPDGFELIAGERRLRASRLAGLAAVPVVITEATDEESLELAIIENIQREDLNAIEEAEAYRSLMAFGLTQDEVAKKVGKERATVANYLRLLRLPPEVKEEMVKGSISMGHARALLSVEGHGAQVELLKKILAKGLSVREAEALAASRAAKKTPRAKASSSSAFAEVEGELRGIFGTKVSFKETRGRGRIEIFYFSEDERERLIDLMRNISGR